MRKVPGFLLLLFSTLLVSFSTLLAQQTPGLWRLQQGSQSTSVREETERGYAALPASALVSVGAEVWYERNEVVAMLGGGEIRFRVGSPEVKIGGETKTLSNPVYEDGGLVYVPADFFRRFLEGASAGALVVEPAERLVRRTAPPAARQPEPRRSTVAAALERVVPAGATASPLGTRPAPASADRATGRAESEDRSADRRASTDRASTPSTAATERAASADASPAQPQRPVARTASASARAQRRLVVVDAGHGGRDPGARGPGGTREKDITLRISRRVAELLRDDPAFDVRMTRTSDTLIALHDRARFANRWRAEGQPAVFISIHCNANESRSEKGFETYFLSEARTADARRVEQFENSAVQYEEHPAGDPMAFILTDLKQNHYLRESSEWARIIQGGLREIHPGPNRGVKQAGFAVLRGTFMPSVLVEIGFISNHQEERLLNDRDTQERIARQLVESIKSYFERPASAPASED